MNKNFIPTYCATSIYDLDANKLLNLGYLYILTDLDNTLAGPYDKIATQKVYDLIANFQQVGLKVFILSNNRPKRVATFATPLNVNYLYKVGKPGTKKMQKFLNDNQLDPSKCIIIGDQVMTDILMANRLKINSILVNRLTNIDQVVTIFPRMLDKFYRHKLKKANLLKEF